MREKIRESEYGSSPNNFHITRAGNELQVELTYPDISPDGVHYVFVDQESVRASDGIRLCYDYSRDGWSIQQASKFSWNSGDKDQDRDWQEVAFVESWARAETEEQQSARLAEDRSAKAAV